MPLRIHTVYTKERLLGFNDFIAKSKRFFLLMMLIASIIVCGSAVLVFLMDGFDGTMLFYMLLVLLMDALYLFLSFGLSRVMLKKNKSLDTVIEYSFDIDSFSFKAENQYANEDVTVKYAAIVKALKNKSDLYLFITPQQAYIVDLSTLSREEYTTLKDVIAARVPAKKNRWQD